MDANTNDLTVVHTPIQNKNMIEYNKSAEKYAIDNDLIGYISHTLIYDPVKIEGEQQNYEKNVITTWLDIDPKSPLTNKRATVENLIPDDKVRQDIRAFIKKYPESDIVKEWQEHKPSWYTPIVSKIPSVQEMSRQCNKCCSSIGDRSSAALALGVCGGLVGCTCGFPAEGAKCGAACGACIGKKGCIGEHSTWCDALLETCGMCGECIQRQNYVRDGGRRRKTIKRKQKKMRKTRKHKRKKTVKKKRKKKRKKTRRRRKK